MKALIEKVEPLIWAVFGGGFFVGTLLLPAYIFVIGIAAPLGWAPADAVSYERMHGLAANLLGRVVFFGAIVLLTWNAANHLRHYAIDWGLYEQDRVIGPLLYLLAALATALALVAVIRL